MKRAVFIAALFIGGAANAAVSPVLLGLVSEVTSTILQLLGALTAAGCTLWVASVVGRKFMAGMMVPTGFNANIYWARQRAQERLSARESSGG